MDTEPGLKGPSISEIFSILEKNKESLNIESYLLSQTTLEQIFMSFANKSSSNVHKNDSIKKRQIHLFSNSKYTTNANNEKNSNLAEHNINEKLGNDPVLLSINRLQLRTESLKTQTLKKLRKMKNKIKRIEEYQF